MEDMRWNMFSGGNSICQASVEDTNEFPGTDLLLEDNFESEIVTRRFQEGGLSFTSAASDSYREDNYADDDSESDNRSQCLSEVDSIMSLPPNDLIVKFDVLQHRVVQKGKKKYVLYTIIVMEVPKLDTDQAIIERRYSDFHNLHRGLRKEIPAAIKNVPFPKKEFFGNYDNELLERRGRKFEKYLRYIFHQQGVRHCQAFKEFFYLHHLRAATECLRSEDYTESQEQFRIGLQLQKKLQDSSYEIASTLCALVEVCRAQQKFVDAEQYASQALEIVQYNVDNVYLLPLMKSTIDLRIKLKLDFAWLHDKLRQIESKTRFDVDSQVTLRELAVRKY